MDKKVKSILRTNFSIKLLFNTLIGYKSGERTLKASLAYFIKGVSNKLNIFSTAVNRWYLLIDQKEFDKLWLIDFRFYNFKGALVPFEKHFSQENVFQDTFYFYVLFNDNYDSELVRKLDTYLNEGPYGYEGDGINVKVEKGDVVIDAGAWIGDFSAYAAAKGAIAYAFEPTSTTFEVLERTAKLNEGRFYAIKKGLGNISGICNMFIDNDKGEANSIAILQEGKNEKIEITTLDSFAQQANLEKISFIKADIEGAERDMLLGAREVLKKFSPKLAICTYHLPDDPEVLERIILEANPRYKIIHTKSKLFAQVK